MARLYGGLLNWLAPVRHNLILFVRSGGLARVRRAVALGDEGGATCAAGPGHLRCVLRSRRDHGFDKALLGHVLVPLYARWTRYCLVNQGMAGVSGIFRAGSTIFGENCRPQAGGMWRAAAHVFMGLLLGLRQDGGDMCPIPAVIYSVMAAISLP